MGQYILLILLLAGCFLWGLAYKVSAAAMIWYLDEKKIPFPTDEDLRKGTRYAVEHLFKRAGSIRRH